MPYQNVHWPLEAPQEFLDMFSEVPDNARQHVCAMAKILDQGVGNITAALKAKGIYETTIQIFSCVFNPLSERLLVPRPFSERWLVVLTHHIMQF
jgi:hypothetical protein